ncbi:P-loop containing nucleoside triphosphate hydrolase protein [Ochromonadaceae sp. CCMP2298]|nr:P-loop containing nucleoside triphosphate hydrolase protein [Ochromonadaceae sp. CCMP2298]
MHRVVSAYTRVDDTNSNIQVFVRARPLEEESEASDFMVTDPEDSRKLIIKDPEASHKRYGEVSFQFDRVFWTNTKQEDVFNVAVKTGVDHVMAGFNSCTFAYGQTGSGKTYTMFGDAGEIRGVIPRSVEYLFQSLAKKTNTSEVAMVCSFLEIYNDQIRDLGKAYLAAMGVEGTYSSALNEKTSDLFERLAGYRGNPYFAPAFHKQGSAMQLSGAVRPGMKEVQDEFNTMNYEIREDNEGNVFVKDLTLVPVTTMEEVMSLIATGLRVRATHETKMNAFSSRSHTVFTITVLQRDKVTGEAVTGMLNLVDLAGSERLKKSESIGVRLKEALHINSSLTALGKVIMALDPSSEQTHIPYRDSKLTRVLQNSLGGNSYTSVIATVNPTIRFYEECLSSLQFANRCRNVRNNPKVNYVEDTEDKDRKIRKLQEEILTMRTKIGQLNGGGETVPGGPPGRSKMDVQSIISLLKKLGIAASTSADGTLMVNGQKFAAEEIGVVGEGSTASSDGANYGVHGASVASHDKLTKQMKDLKETSLAQRNKAEERKIQLEEQGRQLQKMSADLVKLQTGMRHKEFECKALAEDKVRSLEEMRASVERKYASDLQTMLDHNKQIMVQQTAEIGRIPATLLEYTRRTAVFQKEKTDFEAPLRVEFEEQLRELDKSRGAELESVKRQFRFWMEEKDKALSGFVDAFNAYRTKKSEQLRMAEREIVKLYDNYALLEGLVAAARSGKYPIRFKDAVTPVLQHTHTGTETGASAQYGHRPSTAGRRSTMVPSIEIDPDVVAGLTSAIQQLGGVVKGGHVVIPAGDIPNNPVLTLGVGLTLTKVIVMKHIERTERLKRMKADALRKSLHFVEKSAIEQYQRSGKHTAAGHPDDSLKVNVKSFLVVKRSSVVGVETAGATLAGGLGGLGGTETLHPHQEGKKARPSTAGARVPRTLCTETRAGFRGPSDSMRTLPSVLSVDSAPSYHSNNSQGRMGNSAPGGLEGNSHIDSWHEPETPTATAKEAQEVLEAQEAAQAQVEAEALTRALLLEVEALRTSGAVAKAKVR